MVKSDDTPHSTQQQLPENTCDPSETVLATKFATLSHHDMPSGTTIQIICFNALDGHVSALSVCACVCRDWQAAVSEPSLWRSCLHDVPTRITDERLLALLRRGRAFDAMHCLDLRQCTQLTNGGLLAAIAPLTELTHLNVSGTMLTAAGVVAACAGKRLCLLEVAGVRTNELETSEDDLDALQLIGALDVNGVCAMMKDYEVCNRLYSTSADAVICSGCEAVSCGHCASKLTFCGRTMHGGCAQVYCQDCVDENDELMVECGKCHVKMCSACTEGGYNFFCGTLNILPTIDYRRALCGTLNASPKPQFGCQEMRCTECEDSHSPYFCIQCECLFCESCTWNWPGDHLSMCDNCEEFRCPVCACTANGRMEFCNFCKHEYCQDCAFCEKIDIRETRGYHLVPGTWCKDCRCAHLPRARRGQQATPLTSVWR